MSRGVGSGASSCQERGGLGPWRAEGTSSLRVKRSVWRARAEVSLPGVNECASGMGDSKYTSTSFFFRMWQKNTQEENSE